MARASSLLEEAECLLRDLCDARTRCTDFLVRFREVDRIDGEIRPTGRRSSVYGWRWDRDAVQPDGTVGGWANLDELPDPEILELDCNPIQFGILCDDEHEHILVVGSRGSGKSETGDRWLIKRIAVSPKAALSLLVAKRKKARRFVEKKLLPLLPQQWLTSGDGNKGKRGYRKSQDEIALSFRNGCMVDCLSAKVADDARGDDQVGALIDEAQLCPAEARENLILSGRRSEEGAGAARLPIQTLETATLLAGEFESYIEAAQADPTYRVVELSITDNIHLETVYDEKTGRDLPALVLWARQHMDPLRFEQEIGKWDEGAQRFRPVAAKDSGLVLHQFKRSANVLEYHAPDAHPEAATRAIQRLASSIEKGVGEDITAELAEKRFGVAHEWLHSVDWQPDPLAAISAKVFQGPPGHPPILWVLREYALADADPTALGEEIMHATGGGGCVPDAAGSKHSKGKKSSNRLLRRAGLDVRGPTRNPWDVDLINAVNAKLCNANGEVSLTIDPSCVNTITAAQKWRRSPNGKPALMEGGEERYGRALGYLVHFFWPSKAEARAA